MAESLVILLTGSGGQVGGELLSALAPMGKLVAPSRSDLDLADADAVRAIVRTVRPTHIVNAAAYTAVDRAESEAELCSRVNADAPRVLAEEAARAGAWILHYSTDYVFDGRKDCPYHEDDEPAPPNVYGRTKLAGERGIAGSGARYIILRTSWVYGTRGSNFLRTMLTLAQTRPEIRVVRDQTGSPTWSRSIARATATLIERLEATPGQVGSGLYHLTASGSTTWYDFARAIFDAAAARDVAPAPRVVPIESAEYPTVARRPAYSVLDSGKIRREFGVEIPHWQLDLDRVMAELFPSIIV
jgi:dTDP-4-dehydrorhamnose reductase